MTTKVEIAGDKLVLTVTGIDVLLSLRKHMEMPLSAVTSVEKGVSKDAQDKLGESFRVGAYLPGVATGGYFYEHGKWMFWNIHKGAKAITIGLTHDKYEYLVVEVEDPDAALATIRAALPQK